MYASLGVRREIGQNMPLISSVLRARILGPRCLACLPMISHVGGLPELAVMRLRGRV